MNKIIKVCAVAACATMIVGCAKNSADIGEQVKNEMQTELVKTAGLKALQMKEVRLIKKDDLNYVGVGKGEIDGCPIKFDVKCQYDGATVLWDAELSDDNLAVLAMKEKAKETYAKVKAAWPGVKSSLKSKCEAASKKAGEYYDAAAKKSGEYYDAASKKAKSYYDAAKKKMSGKTDVSEVNVGAQKSADASEMPTDTDK